MKPGSPFTKGMRIRMNILAMYLSLFIPWVAFVGCCAIVSFLSYKAPYLALSLIVFIVLLAVGLMAVAVWARRQTPEPTWFSYLALMVLIACFSGCFCGCHIYENFIRPYSNITDLKAISNFDPSNARGQNVMDVGVFHFARGSAIDESKSWHFRFQNVYCVAPVVRNHTTPLMYDFWAVGKDCCSMSSSDFRCGGWVSQGEHVAIREVDDEDLPYYRLAVAQAASLYGISAPQPVFFKWIPTKMLQNFPKLATTTRKGVDMQSLNAANFGEVSNMYTKAYRFFAVAVGTAFCVCLFCMVLATCSYSWLGRTKSRYAERVYDPYYDHHAPGPTGLFGRGHGPAYGPGVYGQGAPGPYGI